jgi:hypothetical protein
MYINKIHIITYPFGKRCGCGSGKLLTFLHNEAAQVASIG